MNKNKKSSRRPLKRRSRINNVRQRPYGGLVPAKQRPLTTQNHLVRNIPVTIDVADAEAALTVGSVASSIAATGVTVSSFVIRKITCYGKQNFVETETYPSTFLYVPTNESWTFSGVAGISEAKLAYVPPIVSSGPFSSAQSGLALMSTTNVTTVIIEVQAVLTKPPPFNEPPLSPSPSLSARVEHFNIVNPPHPPTRTFLRK